MLAIIEEAYDSAVLGISMDQIRRQFEMEYGVNINDNTIESAGPYAVPTHQELSEEELYRALRVYW